MKRGAAEAADDERDAERPHVRCEADERQHGDANDRSDQQQHTRPPAIRDVAEAKLRNRVRELKAHLQRAGTGKRQVQPRNEEGQKRREDISVAVDDEMRGRQQQNGGVKAEWVVPGLHRAVRRNLRITRAIPSLNSGMRSSHAVAASTASAMAIDALSLAICQISGSYGSTVASHALAP